MEVPTTRRSRPGLRDWLVDIGLFLLAVLYGVLMSDARLQAGHLPEPAWLFDLDQIVGALGCAALWLRRRWPVGLAVALVVVSTFAELVAGAMLVALFTVAVHRPPRTTLAVYTLSVLAALGYVLIRPEPGESPALLWVLGVAVQGAAVGWGLVIHHRRQLVLSLRDRAARAETEARLRAEQAQHRTREAIAREMHDVLGHRLSLLSVHAGALEYHPHAPAEDVASAAAVIRKCAHQALQDLREVIGVLRAPVGELPQPTLADLPRLLGEAERAGTGVELRDDLDDAAPPEGTGRTAYRVVQEALTNVRKHAPGAAVSVRLAGMPGRELTVEVENGPPPAPPTPDTSPGQGLVGLAERAALAGGRLEHGTTATGGWRLAARLPWPV
ncbi:Signal transduction histidine kinase [Amycolatopsis arida]|uniref:histidine kinase n=1 Tax=Amycolatopsis arida TaxID=587909 RepID=A0A1I5PB79_9PSEU|nr:histidine kinase [Amycolatopsis arida]TDX98413.1 signal transduction histidine kinase [Amycolatopsis arida]SFP30726.1 Signal transduction histidine kinase [Amycolatopsis arida]